MRMASSDEGRPGRVVAWAGLWEILCEASPGFVPYIGRSRVPVA
ncbi:MAG: hypothetical protein PHU25_18465 [Deltaproteobacteria bacterium]|nr:hypothetical protein [Deltaproteobacteria bacterium]